MPILIAEKMGPHFAVGDTCYSHAEEVKVYNPDGKEIVARDNEVAALRSVNPSKAYFNCHTDITIPYDELAELTAVKRTETGSLSFKRQIRPAGNGRTERTVAGTFIKPLHHRQDFSTLIDIWKIGENRHMRRTLWQIQRIALRLAL